MSGKSAETRIAILNQALRIALDEGLANVTVGALAARAGMSKSGVFAHFGSVAALHVEVLELNRQILLRRVVEPLWHEPPGVGRLVNLFRRWVECIGEGVGGLILRGAMENAGSDEAVRQKLRSMVEEWQAVIRREVEAAIKAGELAVGTEPDQFVYELLGLTFSLHQEWHLMRRYAAGRAMAGLQRLIDDCRHGQPVQRRAKPVQVGGAWAWRQQVDALAIAAD